MNVLQHHPIEAASDEELVERLYDIACEGVDSDELERLDAVIYSRLATAYGEPVAPADRPRSLAA
ncbi:MAG: hypothetical protein A2579_10130 [Lysobacterales bacterium RIFOXYD1_FULL_69_11]|nr:MAG: hypothetical protein A2579_10130 [Xanthomonadales bacterium RIFOXYD1_FULL_69_11]